MEKIRSKHNVCLPMAALFLVAMAGIVAAVDKEKRPAPNGWVLNEQEYFTRPGLEVLLFHNIYPEGKQGGIEIIQHGERIAAVGDLRLAPTPGQWGALPKVGKRTVNRRVPSAEVELHYEKEQLAYKVRLEPCGNAICVYVDLEKPLPAALAGKAGFNLELFPPAFFGKSYDLGGSAGIFPLQGNGPLACDSATVHAMPLAQGRILHTASEDPLRRLTIEAMAGELQLFDGRDNETNGWFVVRSPIPAGASRNAVQWRITPHAVPGWHRTPLIAYSQVGYHPDQEKRALIELPAGTTDLGRVTLLRIPPGKAPEPVLTRALKRWGRFLRYDYAVFDFSAVRASGLYLLRYQGQQTLPFRIALDIYRQGVWQPTLETFFPAQMCHMRVIDRGRVWHGLCHMDDARQAPPNHDLSYIEEYRQGPTTDTPYEAFQHIPGLDRGGWHDAGDFDLATGSQAWVTLLLALIRENFGLDSDQTTVDPELRAVSLHVPDGKPDILQQIAHGVENLLAGYRLAGHSFAGISDPSLEQYQSQGDAASMTDNRIYDPGLAANEIRGDSSGRCDDRVAFTNRDSGMEYQVAAALSAASRVLADFNPALAQECRSTAIQAWEYEQSHQPTRLASAYVPETPDDPEVLATVELLLTTNEPRFSARLKALLPLIEDHAESVGWSVTRVLPQVNDQEFSRRVAAALARYGGQLQSELRQNPFGVPFDWQIWGVTWDIQDYAVRQYFLRQAFPRVFDRENILRVLNYVLGCHPTGNTSLVSGVGSHSLTVAYGTNVNEWSCIPGGGVSGPALIRPDLPELKEPFPFLWQQSEYVIGGAATYLFTVLAAERLLADQEGESIVKLDGPAVPFKEIDQAVQKEMQAAGSLVTTAKDYARFLVAVLRGTGLSKATRMEMLKPQVAISSTTMFGPGAWDDQGKYKKINLSWGLGFGRFDSAADRAFFHTGHDNGAQNYTVTYFDKGTGIVLLSNSDNFEGAAAKILKVVIGDVYTPYDWLGYIPPDPGQPREIPKKRVPAAIDTRVYQKYAGHYFLNQEKSIKVKAKNGRLLATDDGSTWLELLPFSAERFFCEGEFEEFSFRKDDKGNVTHFVIHLFDVEIPCKRIEGE